jgi:hypothetical protein
VNLQTALFAAGIVNETQFPEPVHKEAYSGSSGSDHLCKRLLADPGNHILRNAFFAKVSQHEKDAGQPLFAGIEQLVNQILFVANIAGEQIRNKISESACSRCSALDIARLSIRMS